MKVFIQIFKYSNIRRVIVRYHIAIKWLPHCNTKYRWYRYIWSGVLMTPWSSERLKSWELWSRNLPLGAPWFSSRNGNGGCLWIGIGMY